MAPPHFGSARGIAFMGAMPPRGGGASANGLGRLDRSRPGAMPHSFWLLLAAKMLTTAIIVVAASKIVERAGPFIGAMVATLPISAGPSYIFLAAEHGAAFVHDAALPSLATNAATFGFGALYALLARRQPLWLALGLSFGLWIVAALAIIRTPWTLGGATLLNIAVFIPAFLATRACRATAPGRPPHTRWWDIPFRAALVMALVGATVVIGRLLGPAEAGVAALVPIVMFSLAIILQPRIGGLGAGAVIAHALPGLAGFGLAVAVLRLTVLPLGAPVALTLALCVCVFWNVGLALLRNIPLRRAQRT